MTRYRVLIAGRARSAVVRIQAWWKENRTAAPALFLEEFTHALELLENNPSVGQPWSSDKVSGVRRWRLPKTHYHVYYVVDVVRLEVTVRMVWSPAAFGARCFDTHLPRVHATVPLPSLEL